MEHATGANTHSYSQLCIVQNRTERFRHQHRHYRENSTQSTRAYLVSKRHASKDARTPRRVAMHTKSVLMFRCVTTALRCDGLSTHNTTIPFTNQPTNSQPIPLTCSHNLQHIYTHRHCAPVGCLRIHSLLLSEPAHTNTVREVYFELCQHCDNTHFMCARGASAITGKNGFLHFPCAWLSDEDRNTIAPS